MSILTVENVTHGFGSRCILENASFRLPQGGAHRPCRRQRRGKSTFLSIVTGKTQPDEGTVTWCNHITTGYLDQYSSLPAGSTIGEVLRGFRPPLRPGAGDSGRL